MPLFIDSADMVATYGEAEMIHLTDRVQPQAGVIDPTVMDANIDDAEAEIITALGCCFDMTALFAVYTGGGFVPTVNHWSKVFTRLHLYSSLERDDSQVTKAYTDCKEEMKELCKCGILVDNNGNQIPRLTKFQFVEGRCCSSCGCNVCCCGQFKRYL